MPEAANEYQQFVKDAAGTPQEIEARFRLGEVQMAMNQPAEARRTWQDLLTAHADDKERSHSRGHVQNRRNLRAAESPPTTESLEPRRGGARKLFEEISRPQAGGDKRICGSPKVTSIVGRHDDAVKALDRFLADKRYADRDEIADARNLLGRAYQLQKKFPEALAAWREYLAKHPTHHDWNQVQQEIVNTEFLLGAEKSALKQYDEARKLWTEFLAKYPLDGRNPASCSSSAR